jgi:hypothetical protein
MASCTFTQQVAASNISLITLLSDTEIDSQPSSVNYNINSGSFWLCFRYKNSLNCGCWVSVQTCTSSIHSTLLCLNCRSKLCCLHLVCRSFSVLLSLNNGRVRILVSIPPGVCVSVPVDARCVRAGWSVVERVMRRACGAPWHGMLGSRACRASWSHGRCFSFIKSNQKTKRGGRRFNPAKQTLSSALFFIFHLQFTASSSSIGW